MSGWEDFANGALKFFVDIGKLDYAQFEQLSKLPARTRLSIAVGLERKHETDINFKKLLDAVHDHSRNAEGKRIYGFLGKLARTFITTNYDEWLEAKVDSAPEVSESETKKLILLLHSRGRALMEWKLRRGLLSQEDVVIHIHGSVRERKSMVLTASDYLSRYASHRVLGSTYNENTYLTFLAHAFRSRSILFVGYGLSELEVLEHVIQKATALGEHGREQSSVSEEPRHFLLQFLHARSVSDAEPKRLLR